MLFDLFDLFVGSSTKINNVYAATAKCVKEEYPVNNIYEYVVIEGEV